jgi:hypothetical protein
LILGIAILSGAARLEQARVDAARRVALFERAKVEKSMGRDGAPHVEMFLPVDGDPAILVLVEPAPSSRHDHGWRTLRSRTRGVCSRERIALGLAASVLLAFDQCDAESAPLERALDGCLDAAGR